jgi:hypothetical protein
LGNASEGSDAGAICDHDDWPFAFRDVESRGDCLDPNVFRVGLEVVGGEAVLEDRNTKIEVAVVRVPGGESVGPYVIEAQLRQEL